jgi:asparaginyl-tRNA synthetase
MRSVARERVSTIEQLSQETSLRVSGVVREHAKLKGTFEVGVTELEVRSAPTARVPHLPKEHGTDFLMDHRHLWLRQQAAARDPARARTRSSRRSATTSTTAASRSSTRRSSRPTRARARAPLRDRLPRRQGVPDAERPALHGGGRGRGRQGVLLRPTFRAEKSKTRRHLAEFWMVEPEVAFMDLDGDMDLAEDFLCSIVERVLDKRRKELEIHRARHSSKLEAHQEAVPAHHLRRRP